MRRPNCPRHKDAHYTGGAHGVNAGGRRANTPESRYKFKCIAVAHWVATTAPVENAAGNLHCHGRQRPDA